jgi:putative ABC transport system permease protein
MTAPPPCSAAARTAMLVARDGKAFPQSLFVDLRRAGWPVSPVVEGRIQIGGRGFRLLASSR